MRVTIPIYSWSNCWYPEILKIDLKVCFPDGKKLDEVEFRKQIKDNKRVLMSSDDDYSTCAFTAILFNSVQNLIDDTSIDKSDKSYASVFKRISKRIDDSKSSFVRIDITTRRIGTDTVLKVNIVYKDNWGVIQTDRYDKQFALMLADFCKCYDQNYVKAGFPPMIFTDNVKDLFRELKEYDRQKYNCADVTTLEQ